ncbi:MAG: hypothetical protein LBC72_03515 [Spirochaetaceae bacterium]|jgi:hypothetical protein|nr:hypothetical protein [Spirochaetaceae bacterium]
MKLKCTIVALVLWISATAGVYAEFGIGIQGNVGFAGGGPSLLLSPSDRLHFALDWYIPINETSSDILFNIAIDMWALDVTLLQAGPGELKLFVGPGFFVRTGYLKTDDEYRDGFNLAGGLRIPVGIHYRIQGFDPFLVVAPAWDIKILPKTRFSDWLGFSGALGIRFWI